MSRCDDVYENRATGEYAVILRGTEDRGDGPGIAHLTARPGAAVVGEHFHPNMVELRRDPWAARGEDRRRGCEPRAGRSRDRGAGVPHDWWNASKTEDAHVLVIVEPAPGAEDVDANRFEAMIGTLFGLANDGKVVGKGRPYTLQAALILREFADIVALTSTAAGGAAGAVRGTGADSNDAWLQGAGGAIFAAA